MQKLQGIAVSPGVAIGEALVMDNEGFRIPRRFVARDAVVDETGAARQGHRGGGGRNRPPPRDRLRRVGREVRRDLRGPPADAPGLAAPQRTGGDDPPAALLARVRRQPHPAALRPGLPAAGKLVSGGAGQRHLRHREAAAAAPAGPPPRRHRPPHLARAGAGPQPHAQRNGQSRPPLRPRLRHRDRRAGQPHGDRGRGAGNPGRRGHRAVPDRGLRRRAGDHRRRQGAGDPPARRRDAGPLSPRGRGNPHPGRPSSSRSATCPPKPATASASNCWATSSFPTRSIIASIAGPTAWACTAPSSSTSAPRSSRPRRSISRPIPAWSRRWARSRW